MSERAWAAKAPDWACPPNFINVDSVSGLRRDAQAYIGEVWALEGETPMQGWKRAYRAGWRVVKVYVDEAFA